VHIHGAQGVGNRLQTGVSAVLLSWCVLTAALYADCVAVLVCLLHAVWLRSCTLLYSKPRMVLVMGGCDPIITRRLGQPQDESVVINLGLNYHLDSYLDEDSKRFAEEFPQCFQVSPLWKGSWLEGDTRLHRCWPGDHCATC
jgi:hypothetical protein